ncbi:MAG: omptin family outer membrane protease [Treponemataceae bacterium]|nr:omptin family outer membrane protease [Treponemataceae bacterium]
MKNFFIASLIFLTGFCAFSAEKENPQKTLGWNFGIEGIFGARFGKEGEIVWAKNSQNGDKYKLSELEWGYTPALYAGAKIGGGYKRFEISFASIFFFPTTFGTMKDSDWNQDNGYKNGNTSIKTNYSESDNKIKNGFELELSIAFKFYPTNFLTLRPKISLGYQQMEFNAMGGTLWYGKNKDVDSTNNSYYSYDDAENSISRTLPYKPVIKYNFQNIYFWTGIQADFLPTKKILLSLATEAAPIVYMNSCDQHIEREMVFRNISLSAFFAVRQSARAQFNFNNNFSIALNLCGMLTGQSTGVTYEKGKGENLYKKYDDSSGAYSLFFDIGISAKFVL